MEIGKGRKTAYWLEEQDCTCRRGERQGLPRMWGNDGDGSRGAVKRDRVVN